MTDPDDALLAELASALGPRIQPPPEVLEVAREVFTWRTIDAELAALTYDSLVDEPAAVVRADIAPPRVLMFETDAASVEIEWSVGDPVVTGRLSPGRPAELEVWFGDGTEARATSDDLGRFTVGVPAGTAPVRLRFASAADGRSVVVVLPRLSDRPVQESG